MTRHLKLNYGADSNSQITQELEQALISWRGVVSTLGPAVPRWDTAGGSA